MKKFIIFLLLLSGFSLCQAQDKELNKIWYTAGYQYAQLDVDAGEFYDAEGNLTLYLEILRWGLERKLGHGISMETMRYVYRNYIPKFKKGYEDGWRDANKRNL